MSLYGVLDIDEVGSEFKDGKIKSSLDMETAGMWDRLTNNCSSNKSLSPGRSYLSNKSWPSNNCSSNKSCLLDDQKDDGIRDVKRGWDRFPSIRCINLLSRIDRYEASNTLFKKMSIPVDYYRVEKSSNPEEGCYNSHLGIMKECLEAGKKYVLIFEDDLVDNKSLNINIDDIVDFLEQDPSWEIFYLGVMPDLSRKPMKKVKDIKGASIHSLQSICTHAYIVHERFMKKFCKTSYIDIPIDYLFVQNKNSYGIYPSLFYQGTSKSDISPGLMSSNIPYKDTLMSVGEYALFTLNLTNREMIIILVVLLIVCLCIFIQSDKPYLYFGVLIIAFLFLFLITRYQR